MNEQSNDFGVGYAVGRDSSQNNGGWGFGNGDWIWAIILLALVGNGGWGFGGGFGGGGYGGGFMPYELGKVATQADIASGFNNSTVLSSLNDLKLGQSSGFAGVQQTLCQGFNGVNTSLLQGFHGVDNSVCTLGYQNQAGFNAIANQISSCCCDTRAAISDLKYANEKQTCDIISAINAGNQRLVDIYTGDKIEALRAENTALKGQISNDKQSAYIIDKLSPCPSPSYIVPNPNCCYNYGVSGFGYNNSGCGCGC